MNVKGIAELTQFYSKAIMCFICEWKIGTIDIENNKNNKYIAI